MREPSLTISVVIASYGRPDLLRQTVAGLLPQLGADGEIVVAEQAPTADLADEFSRMARVRYFRLPRPGTVAARNFAIGRARGDILLFVDDDVIARPGLLAAHREPYTDPAVGGVAGRVIDAGQEPASALDPRAADPVGGWRYYNFDHPVPMDVPHAPTCNLSLRRDVVVRAGGFDPAFRLAWREDSDLCFRVRALGYRIVYHPPAALVHLSAGTGGTRGSATDSGPVGREMRMYRKYFLHYRDNLYFVLKHFRGPARRRFVVDAYRDYVGLSRWPWRLAAKNACFLAALGQAWWAVTRSPSLPIITHETSVP
jgi:GT2 family glycosyltransferase